MTCQRLLSDLDKDIWGPAPFVCEYADVLERTAQVFDSIDQCRRHWYGTDLTLGMWLATPHPALGGETPMKLIQSNQAFRPIEYLYYQAIISG